MSANLTSDTRARYWQEHVQACQHSGLSKAQYCRDHQLAYHVLIYWSTKFSGRIAKNENSEQSDVAKLVPVALSGAIHPDSGLQVHLPNGVHISGINAQSVDFISRVINQL